MLAFSGRFFHFLTDFSTKKHNHSHKYAWFSHIVVDPHVKLGVFSTLRQLIANGLKAKVPLWGCFVASSSFQSSTHQKDTPLIHIPSYSLLWFISLFLALFFITLLFYSWFSFTTSWGEHTEKGGCNKAQKASKIAQNKRASYQYKLIYLV